MRNIFILIFIIFLPIIILSQEKEFIDDFENTFSVVESHKHFGDFKTKNIILNIPFRFYKTFISSQDSRHCSFNPSCSIYSYKSIQKNGLLIGILDSFDRLTRCNNLSRENYKKDLHGQLIDFP